MLECIVFYGLAAAVLGSALGVVILRNVLHSALFLGLALACTGGIFALCGSDFLFVSQILVYVGGIALLILFVVLLSGRSKDLQSRQINDQWLAALVVAGTTVALLYRSLSVFSNAFARTEPAAATLPIGRLLLTDYLVPFELVSLLLLAALMGAVWFTRSKT